MPHIPIALFYGSLTALLLGLLGMNVSRARGKTGLADTPSPELLRVIRAHGNCAEWAPILILVLVMLELSGVRSMPLHVFGGGILLARIIHGAGVLMKKPFSVAGAGITYLLMLVMPIYGVILHFQD